MNQLNTDCKMKKFIVEVYEVECTLPITFKCDANNEEDIIQKYQLNGNDISTYIIKEEIDG